MKSSIQKAAIVIFAITIFGMLAFSSIVYADENQSNSNNTTSGVGPQSIFNKMNLVGKGIAISTTNSTDVHVIKIAVAQVDLTSLIQRLSQYVTLPLGIPSIVQVGVFHFDNTTYKLTNIVVTNNTVSADIDSNGTTVGSINLQWTIRANRILWIGNLTLNDNNYNAYILEGRVIGVGRQCEPGETDDMACRVTVVKQCRLNPNATSCGLVVAGERAHFPIRPISLPTGFREHEVETGSSNVTVTQGLGVNAGSG